MHKAKWQKPAELQPIAFATKNKVKKNGKNKKLADHPEPNNLNSIYLW